MNRMTNVNSSYHYNNNNYENIAYNEHPTTISTSYTISDNVNRDNFSTQTNYGQNNSIQLFPVERQFDITRSISPTSVMNVSLFNDINE